MADLVPSSQLLDTYSPELFCGIRNIALAAPSALDAFGGNGYSLSTMTEILGAPPNPYVYPDNLPRTNGRGGPPGGAPGCWQTIDRNFWPAPYLVMDDGGLDRAVQPLRTRPALAHRVRVGGASGRREHHQPEALAGIGACTRGGLRLT